MRSIALAVLCLVGCSRVMGTSDKGHEAAPIRAYPDGPDGLKQFWGDVLEAARKDDRVRVHDLLATTLLTDEDLVELFGADGAKLYGGRYHGLMAAMINPGSIELCAQVYERKLDDVEVIPYEDASVTAALKVPVKMYSVRLKRAADSKGMRYDFFVYRRGKWLTGNQLAKYLTKP
jgi:hypothetical protein